MEIDKKTISICTYLILSTTKSAFANVGTVIFNKIIGVICHGFRYIVIYFIFLFLNVILFVNFLITKNCNLSRLEEETVIQLSVHRV